MGYKLWYRSRSQLFPIDFHSSYKLTVYTVTRGLHTGDRVDIIEWNRIGNFQPAGRRKKYAIAYFESGQLQPSPH